MMDKVSGKLLITGMLNTTSPLHVGNGLEVNSDSDIQRDRNGLPIIPATSFVGVLRHHFAEMETDRHRQDAFWGFMKATRSESGEVKAGDGNQSRICCSHLKFTGKPVAAEIREGVKIDSATAVALDKGKYNLEILPAGCRFSLRMEITYGPGSEGAYIKRMARTIYEELISGIAVGGKINNGFGELKLQPQDSAIHHFNFEGNKEHVLWWIVDSEAVQATRLSPETFDEVLGPSLARKAEPLSIEASFTLKTSLLSRSYSSDPQDVDTTHVSSGGRYILPGSSIKGAVRARAERIANTLEISENFMEGLFGQVYPGEDKRAIRSKIRIRETILPGFIEEVQTRIKIDRFTGGTIHSALVESMPLFYDFTEKSIQLTIEIDPTFGKAEAAMGLMLLVLKDLWSGDLALGGEKSVGRGVLQGKTATIRAAGDEIVLTDQTATNPDSSADRERLESFVTTLLTERNGGSENAG